MTPRDRHEAHVAERFDQLSGRFKTTLEPTDFRLRALKSALGPLQGIRILDLGCGKGRFARALQECGADAIGMDVALGMLGEAMGVSRVLGSARRLPFPSGHFDAVIAVEVIQHLPQGGLIDVFQEVRRALRAGGTFLIIDRNLGALDSRRPWLPSALLKTIDEQRGRWMYQAGGPVRERWYWPADLASLVGRVFPHVSWGYLLGTEETGWVFRAVPCSRRFVLWRAIAGERPS
jgi:2-polyprenyl-6-hydroxyphenyl methylase/3-demethylubiquinone-9 3-methyltransferase